MNLPLCATCENLTICCARYERKLGKLCNFTKNIVLYKKDTTKIRELEKRSRGKV